MADDVYEVNGKLYCFLDQPRICPKCRKLTLMFIRLPGGDETCFCCHGKEDIPYSGFAKGAVA